MIYNAEKSTLVNKEEIWAKQSKSSNDHELFDTTMGSKHSADISELVGLYSKDLKTILEQIDGIYRNDGFIAMDK